MDSNEDCETCWICLEGVEGIETSPGPLHANRLMKPCRCPRVVHSVCLAKWQLSQSGRSEEKFCRFCKERLPEWQTNLALPGMGAVEPVMSVHFNGQTHMVKVKPGEEGRVAFIQDVRRLLRLRENQEFSITFECKVPGHGMFLDLKGLSSYDAAVFCAAMTAVERQRLAAQKAGHKAEPAHGSRGVAVPSANSANGYGGGSNARSGDAATFTSPFFGNLTTNTTTGALTSDLVSPSMAASALQNSPVVNVGEQQGLDANEGHTRTRLVSENDVRLLTPGRGPSNAARGGGNSGEVVSEPPSVPTGSSRSVLSGWRIRGGRRLASPGTAALSAPTDSEISSVADRGPVPLGGGRSMSGPPAPQHPGQHQPASAVARVPRRPRGWGVLAFDSACEVEPGNAAGEETGAAGASAMDDSPPGSAAGDADVRYKFFARHGLRSGTALGGGSTITTTNSSSSSNNNNNNNVSSILPALPEPYLVRRRREYSNGSTWLSRLLLCASFSSDGPRRDC